MLDNINFILGRNSELFKDDLKKYENHLSQIIQDSSFLIIGGAGSIGSALSIEVFKRKPKKLHIVDISENDNVELVRRIRSSIGYIKGEFETFSIDCSSHEFRHLMNNNGSYDYIFNLSALKHVRSEKDPYTLMRMIDTNILNVVNLLRLSKENNVKKFFCVSSDKASNPVNMMGASKRIMEMFLTDKNNDMTTSTARFANVAFSNGSLLYGFTQRFLRKEPLSAPVDIKRYFVTSKESAELCLLSGILGKNNETYFPKLIRTIHLINFADIAKNYLNALGYEPYLCESEDQARDISSKIIEKKMWPCFFFESDTTGEKTYEEFYTEDEKVDLESFQSIGIIKDKKNINSSKLRYFLSELEAIKKSNKWDKKDILSLFRFMLPNFNHIEKDKYLDQKM